MEDASIEKFVIIDRSCPNGNVSIHLHNAMPVDLCTSHRKSPAFYGTCRYDGRLTKDQELANIAQSLISHSHII